jgi:signal transduction histidine kinase/ligand-binding sensor domain-containing protein
MPKHRWIFAIALLLFSGCLTGDAADSKPPYNIRVWGPREGLSSITAMTQTRDGYLWLGTLYGLVRFDGFNLTTFDENNTPGLENNRIFHLFEDNHGGLWVGTETAGIKLIKESRVVSVRPPDNTLRTGVLKSACEDAMGAVWLYMADGKLLHYREGRVEVGGFATNIVSNRRLIIAEKSGAVLIGVDNGLYITNSVRSGGRVVPKLQYLLASQSGGYWCLGNGTVQKWSGEKREVDLGPYPWGDWPVLCAAEDRSGNLVVGTYGGGVYWFDASGKATRISREDGLSADNVLSLVVDHENTLWVGTDGSGLNRVQRSFFEVFGNTKGRTPQSVSEDNREGVWVAMNGGPGAVQYWKDGGSKKSRNTEDLFVKAVLADGDHAWVGTLGPWIETLEHDKNTAFVMSAGLFRLGDDLRPQNVLDTNNSPVSALFKDRKGILWAGFQAGLARMEGNRTNWFTVADGLSANDVRAIAEGTNDDIWIGTDTGGLNLYRNGKFTSFHGNSDGLPSEHISSLLMDGEGVLWIGTSAGLARFDGRKWTRYGVGEGLASNSIGYLLEDGAGGLWIGSNAGLMRVQKKSLNDFASGATNSVTCRTYEDTDGLPTSECTFGSQPAAARLKSGMLLFPTIRGLASVDLTAIRRNTNPPPVLIESVSIEGQPRISGGLRSSIPASITIPAGREHLEIQYTSLNLAAAEKARFRYLMEGFETKGWNDAGKRRVALYPKIPPGNYKFHVTACNEDGVWNEIGATLAIKVLPPFWRKWWFMTASAFCLVGVIAGVVHYISTQKLQRQLAGMRQQQALEKERARIARDIHDQLGASLTQVSLLGEMVESDKDSPSEVEAHAKQISQTARDTTLALDEIVWTVNPSNDTLEGLVTYVCKYVQDYLGIAELRFRLDIPAQLPEAEISPEVRHNVFLTCKEAITNIVRHARAKSVWVRLRVEPSSFVLEIQDDGKGIPNLEEKKAGSRNGLQNMGRRMEDIGGKFDIMAGPEGGTLVRLIVPLKRK